MNKTLFVVPLCGGKSAYEPLLKALHAESADRDHATVSTFSLDTCLHMFVLCWMQMICIAIPLQITKCPKTLQKYKKNGNSVCLKNPTPKYITYLP